MSCTPWSSDLSDSDSNQEAGPSHKRTLHLSSSKADPDVLAPIFDSSLASRRVFYYHSPFIGTFSYGYGHPMKPQRMRMAHSLISAYGLDQCMTLREPKEADKVDMTRFHTDEYIDFLERVNPDNGMALTGAGTRFLVGEDCPPFQSVFQFCSLSSGGSISAASSINSGAADVAINWAGGLHHAKKREASGFCYTNDIVLGILELLRVHARVLYIDIDIHHGDGVEEAFYSTDRVLTLSFHKFGDFFPGTGDVKDVGIGPGKGYAVNVPLRDGIGDDEYQSLLFRPVVQHIMEWYRPGAVVLQCGADSLAGDKLGCFNLSMRGHAACVSYLQSFNVPLLCVGGGGYTVRNVARTWTYETALLVGREPDEDLPFNEYMNWFGPEYKLDVRPTSMENLNSDAYLEGLRSRIIETLKGLPFAPSVQMQSTPKYAINAHAAGEMSDSEEGGELEKMISKQIRRARLRQQMDAPASDVDSFDEEEGDYRQENGVAHASSSSSGQESRRQDRSLKRLLWSGNDRLDASNTRQRSIFEREESVVSNASSLAGGAGAGKKWLGMGFTPNGIASGGMGGPPEALKRILANANRQGSLGVGKNGSNRNDNRSTTTGPRGSFLPSGMELDSEMDDDDDDEGEEEDGDVRMDESSDDEVDASSDDEDGGSSSTFVNGNGLQRSAGHILKSRRRNGSAAAYNVGKLTRSGRPKRSFFDSARPILLNGAALDKRSGDDINVSANGTSTTTAQIPVSSTFQIESTDEELTSEKPTTNSSSFPPPPSILATEKLSDPTSTSTTTAATETPSTSSLPLLPTMLATTTTTTTMHSMPNPTCISTLMQQDMSANLAGSESLDQRRREVERGIRGEGSMDLQSRVAAAGGGVSGGGREGLIVQSGVLDDVPGSGSGSGGGGGGSGGEDVGMQS